MLPGATAARVALALVALVSALFGFLPLFAGPSYEAALAAGATYPLIVAIAVALHVRETRPLPNVAFVHGTGIGTAAGLVGFSVLLLHGLRAGFCEPIAESAFFLLGPGMGAIMAGAWGAFVGTVATLAFGGRRLTALLVIVAALGPLGGIAISLWRFLSSPMVFAFDPFFGYFAGTLYDTVIDGTPRLITYRLGSLASLVAAASLAGALVRRADGRYGFSFRPASSLLGIAALLASVITTLEGPALGHYHTTETIRAELGHSARSERCEVIYATGIRKAQAHALARECDAHVAALERYFEIRGPRTITAFVFVNADQKAALMGARNTYIAKPWRHEVYVQYQPFPHPILGHELAHVVAGTFGQGPFRVAGPLRGWIPDPGRIEGFAVAASPPDEADLTPLEWSAAMKRLGLLPELSNLFRLGFLGENSSSAYTVAGAFVEWVRAEHGAEALRRWYGGESLDVAAGHGLPQLERHFLHVLDDVKLSEAALQTARARFSAPAIFGRRCPHSVDRLTGEAAGYLAGFDPEGAERRYRAAQALDPSSIDLRFALVDCAETRDGPEKAKQLLGELTADSSLTPADAATAKERLGDLALRAGDGKVALTHYETARKAFVSEGRLRTLDVKQFAATSKYRDAVVALLAPDPATGGDFGVAAGALAAWSAAEEKEGLPDFLLGKNFWNRGRWELATVHLDRALERDLSLVRVKREAIRTRLLVACALGDKARLVPLREAYEKTGVSVAQRDALGRLVQRCAALGGSAPESAAKRVPP